MSLMGSQFHKIRYALSSWPAMPITDHIVYNICLLSGEDLVVFQWDWTSIDKYYLTIMHGLICRDAEVDRCKLGLGCICFVLHE